MKNRLGLLTLIEQQLSLIEREKPSSHMTQQELSLIENEKLASHMPTSFCCLSINTLID